MYKVGRAPQLHVLGGPLSYGDVHPSLGLAPLFGVIHSEVFDWPLELWLPTLIV